jgi:hypothetical protein
MQCTHTCTPSAAGETGGAGGRAWEGGGLHLKATMIHSSTLHFVCGKLFLPQVLEQQIKGKFSGLGWL